MKHNPPLIRRTFLQERFDILIKKQRNGSATFNDLTELDDIVNRDPAIRESILEEMQDDYYNNGDNIENHNKLPLLQTEPSLWSKLKSLFNRYYLFLEPTV